MTAVYIVQHYSEDDCHSLHGVYSSLAKARTYVRSRVVEDGRPGRWSHTAEQPDVWRVSFPPTPGYFGERSFTIFRETVQ